MQPRRNSSASPPVVSGQRSPDALWNAPNVLITPHVSGNMTLDVTRDLVVDMFCENIAHYSKGEPLRNLVDRKAGY